ncbi:Demethylmenaquinone methyltransferase [Cladorrhinum sp. PSN259]|nr:Demethylmenaquinone methyltransferase [Cladorrhinum sp. PSN259]
MAENSSTEPSKSKDGSPKSGSHKGSPKSGSSPKSPGDNLQTIDQSILPASHWEGLDGQIRDDGDSAFSEVISSTASLSSSILQYRELHGRTYHGEIGKGEAWAPNDEKMLESMDIHHHFCTLLLNGKLFLSPLTKETTKKVLDVGTGTGIWAIDFADQFPDAEVIGTDLSPIQPSWVPPNVKFEIDDANLLWTWHDNTFDYVHMRALFGAIIDWNDLYKQAFRVTKPGGYFEDHECSVNWQDEDPTAIPEDSPIGQWGKVYMEMGRKFGRTFRVIEDRVQEKAMREAGFVDIEIREFKCPVGGWPKDENLKQTGLFAKLALETDMEGYILYTWDAVLGWSTEQIRVYIAHCRRQLQDPNIRPWYLHRVVYGRKPEQPATAE